MAVSLAGLIPVFVGPSAVAQEPEGTTTADENAVGAAETVEVAAEPRSLESARQAFAAFMLAVKEDDYATAASVLDFSGLAPTPNDFAKTRYVRRLRRCIDQIPVFDPAALSDDPTGPPVPLPPEKPEAEIVLGRSADGLWRFTPGTVLRIDALYEVFVGQPVDGADTILVEKAVSNATSGETPAPVDAEEIAARPEASVVVPDALSSARRTMRTLFDSLDKNDYEAAVATLDFSLLEQSEKPPGAFERLGYARRLRAILDRMARINYARISDDPQGPTFRFPPEQVNQPIQIVRNPEGVWRFSVETVGKVDSLYELYQDKRVINLPEEDRPWLERQLILDNETWRILALFASVFLGIVAGQLLKAVMRWRAKSLELKGREKRATILRTIAAASVGVAFLVGLRAGTSVLVLDHQIGRLVLTGIHVTFVVVIGFILFRLVDVAVVVLIERTERSGSAMNKMLAPIVSTSLRVTIIILVLLEIATAISDQPPSAVLAGLGAGGLAVGLAAQESIKNLFGSVMIIMDRPFEVGDRIVIDGHDGPVEKVGFRSTRIRTLEGHYVTVPNAEMANKTIQNVGRRPYIRRTMDIPIASDTPPEKVRKALEILRSLVDDHEGRHDDYPPRVFLEDFLDAGINLRVIYWYHPPAYWDYCEYGEKLSLQIIESFHASTIRFAIPSQRLLIANDSDSASFDG